MNLLYSVIWDHIAIYCITLYCNTILKNNVSLYYFILHLFHIFLCIVIFHIYGILYFTVTAVLKCKPIYYTAVCPVLFSRCIVVND